MLALAGAALFTGLARAGFRSVPPPSGEVTSPALISLVLTGRPTTAAYAASIAELITAGYLSFSDGASGPVVSVPAEPPDPGPLPGYLRRALGNARAALGPAGPVPFAALAQSCVADVAGTWQPFEQDLLTAARQRGLTRPIVPVTARSVVLMAGTTAVVVAAAFLTAGRVFTSISAVVLLWGLFKLIDRDRLTPAGRALRARWQERQAGAAGDDVPAELESLWLTANGVRSGRPRPRARPDQAWSPMSGTWRPVATGPDPGLGMTGAVALLVAAAMLTLIGFALTIPSGTEPLPLVLVVVAVLLAVAGVRRARVLAALPKSASFDGMVIARWDEDHSDENFRQIVPFISVDDGTRSWTFAGALAGRDVLLGDFVHVTISPRSNELTGVVVTRRQRTAETDPPPEPGSPAASRAASQLTEQEVAPLVGAQARGTMLPVPGGGGFLYSSPTASVSVIVMRGRIADLNLRAGQRSGRPLPGIGDEAWLRRDRIVVLRVGDQVAKLSVTGRRGVPAPPVPLDVAAAVASRLAGAGVRQD